MHFDSSEGPTYVYGFNDAGKSAMAEVVDGLSRNDPVLISREIEKADSAKYRYMLRLLGGTDHTTFERAAVAAGVRAVPPARPHARP